MSSNWKSEQESLRDRMMGEQGRWNAIFRRIEWVEANVVHRNTPEVASRRQKDLWASYGSRRKQADAKRIN